MTQPQPKTPAPTTFTKLLQERAQAERAGAAPDVIAAYDEMIANERKPRTTNADVMKELVTRFGTGGAASGATTSGTKTSQPTATPAPKPTQPAAQPPAQTQPQQYRVGQRVRQGDKIYRFDGAKWVEQK